MQVKNQIDSLEGLQSAICADFPDISVCIKQFDIPHDSNKSKVRTSAGIECAKSVIRKQVDLDDINSLSNLDITYNENGAPIFPGGLVGSISHSDNLAIAVCLQSSQSIRSIGVDIETKFNRALNVISKVASPDENRNLPFSGFTLDESAASIFSIKESFYKAVNVLEGNDKNRMIPTWGNLSVLEINGRSVKSVFRFKNNPNLKYQINLYRCYTFTPFVCAIVVCE